MKKLLTILLVALFGSTGVNAQNESTCFKGVPMGKTLDYFISQMRARDFKLLERSDNEALMSGKYTNKDISLLLQADKNKRVNSLVVTFRDVDHWQKALDQYEDYKGFYMEDYGQPVYESKDLSTFRKANCTIVIAIKDGKQPASHSLTISYMQDTSPKSDDVNEVSGLLAAVTRDTKITDGVDFTGSDKDITLTQIVSEEEVLDDTPFLIADVMPKFQGGDLNTFRAWVQKNVEIPESARENGIQGRVVVTFVIERDGRLSDIRTLQSPDRLLTNEAYRVLQQSPRWTPGIKSGHAVRVKYTLPVDFRLTR